MPTTWHHKLGRKSAGYHGNVAKMAAKAKKQYFLQLLQFSQVSSYRIFWYLPKKLKDIAAQDLAQENVERCRACLRNEHGKKIGQGSKKNTCVNLCIFIKKYSIKSY